MPTNIWFSPEKLRYHLKFKMQQFCFINRIFGLHIIFFFFFNHCSLSMFCNCSSFYKTFRSIALPESLPLIEDCEISIPFDGFHVTWLKKTDSESLSPKIFSYHLGYSLIYLPIPSRYILRCDVRICKRSLNTSLKRNSTSYCLTAFSISSFIFD